METRSSIVRKEAKRGQDREKQDPVRFSKTRQYMIRTGETRSTLRQDKIRANTRSNSRQDQGQDKIEVKSR